MLSRAANRIRTLALGLFVATALSAIPLKFTLSSEEVREAYFLGRSSNDQDVVNFVAPYIHHFPAPEEGRPYVESIEFRSPYEQIVLASRARLFDYNSLDAQKDYATFKDQVLIRVLIFTSASYHWPLAQSVPGGIKIVTGDDLLKEFHFRVSQDHVIEPKKVTAVATCTSGDCDGFPGLDVLLTFDLAQFKSKLTKIEVGDSKGQVAKTEFDLDELK